MWLTLTEQDKVRLGEDTETNTRGARHGGQAVPPPGYFGEGTETNSQRRVLPGMIHKAL